MSLKNPFEEYDYRPTDRLTLGYPDRSLGHEATRLLGQMTTEELRATHSVAERSLQSFDSIAAYVHGLLENLDQKDPHRTSAAKLYVTEDVRLIKTWMDIVTRSNTVPVLYELSYDGLLDTLGKSWHVASSKICQTLISPCHEMPLDDILDHINCAADPHSTFMKSGYAVIASNVATHRTIELRDIYSV